MERVNAIRWDHMYHLAEDYFNENHHLKIPFRYKTTSGEALGTWISRMRVLYNKDSNSKRTGCITEEQIAKLNVIGMLWSIEKPWDAKYKKAVEYYKSYGNLLVPIRFVCADGTKLGVWISSNRISFNHPNKRIYAITPDQIDKLNHIGMVWKIENTSWEDHYMLAKEYYFSHGNLLVPQNYVDLRGVALGKWITKMRARYHRNSGHSPLSDKQIAQLNSIGMIWKIKERCSWNDWYIMAKSFYKKNGHLKIPHSYITENGAKLGRWIFNLRLIRSGKRYGKLSPEQINKLDDIGMIWY